MGPLGEGGGAVSYEPHHVILEPLLTEKSTWATADYNVVAFKVDRRANKHQIREAVEKLFDVEVAKVRTVNMHGKMRRVRWRAGYTGDWKKAYVQLKEGSSIEFFDTEVG